MLGLLLAVLAIAAAMALLALNPKVLTGFSSDRDRQPLLTDTTLGPGLSTGGAVVLTNQGVLPLRYDLRVTGSAEQAAAGVIMRVRLNDDSNYVYQGPVLTKKPVALGVLLPGQSARVQVTLTARASQSTSSIPVDDTFTWTARSPGLETWWWLVLLAAGLAILAFLLPRLFDLVARARHAAPPPPELFWRLPLILAALILCLLIPLNGVTLGAVNFQSANPGNLFAVGTLVLSDATPSGTTCMSITSDVQQSGPPRACSAIFHFTNGTPGMTRQARITIRNVGTVPVAHFLLWAPTPCQNTAGSPVHGTADSCEGVVMAIHDDSHDVCVFPAHAGGPCTLLPASTMGALGHDFTPAAPLALDPQGLGGGITFTFTVQVSPAAANAAQGLAPMLDLEWQVAQ
jgi:hypothetical protein